MTGKELFYIAECLFNGRQAGDGPFTSRCHPLLVERTGCSKALLSHSCTAALDKAALLLIIQSGDEIIMPSYTFVSTDNAFVLRGGVPWAVSATYRTRWLDAAPQQATTKRGRGSFRREIYLLCCIQQIKA